MPLIDTGQLYQTFPEEPDASLRLGRNLWLDARSLSYMIENNAEEMSSALATRAWERHTPILDQGELGSCTGNAGIGALSSDPFYGNVTHGGALDEADAVDLYSKATRVDPFPGQYEPDDTGSSGLAVCKVLKDEGTIHGYRWARSPVGFLHLLQAGPVLMGMPWRRAFFEPDAQGFIDTDANWSSSELDGGHEVCVVGCDIVDPTNLFSTVLTFANSWSESWGDKGYGRLRLRTYEALHEIDLKQFRV